MKKSKPQQALLFPSIKRSGGTAVALIIWHKHKKGGTGLLPLAFMKRPWAHRCEEVQCKHLDVLPRCTRDPLFTSHAPPLLFDEWLKVALLQCKALAQTRIHHGQGLFICLFVCLDGQQESYLYDFGPCNLWKSITNNISYYTSYQYSGATFTTVCVSLLKTQELII